MYKEVKDIKNVCDNIISKAGNAREIADALKELIKNIEENTEQAEIPAKSLSMRKPLASLFILNSDFDDLLKDFERIYDNLKKI